MIKMGDFLAKNEVLKQRWAAQARLQRVLIVRNGDTLIRRQRLSAGIHTYAI